MFTLEGAVAMLDHVQQPRRTAVLAARHCGYQDPVPPPTPLVHQR